MGAARYSNTPAFGVSPPVLEAFSSAGTTPVLFDPAGNRLPTPDPRADKPEVVAPDGVATTVPGFSNFFGTSAAAPHAAGVAALIAASAWTGATFPWRPALGAAVFAAAFAYLYFRVEWLFTRTVLVDVLHRYDERTILWVSNGLALMKWPIILLCAVASVVAALRSR